jgi:hypothetical protein
MLVAAGLTAAPVLAQVAVPPGPPVPKTPEWTPPPPPPMPAPGQGAQPVQPVHIEPEIPQKEWAKYLCEPRDAEGKLPKLAWPRYWAAIKVNDEIATEKQAELEPFFQSRREIYERIAIDNADFIAKIDDGLIEKLNVTDRDSLSGVTKQFKALAGQETAVASLRKQNLLNNRQVKTSEKIVEARNKAEMEEAKKAAGEDKNLKAAALSRQMWVQASEEAMWARRGLLIEGAGRASAAADRAGLSGDALEAVRSAEKAAAAASDDAKYDAMLAALRKMDIDQQREFLRAIVASRPATAEK